MYDKILIYRRRGGAILNRAVARRLRNPLQARREVFRWPLARLGRWVTHGVDGAVVAVVRAHSH